MRCPSVVASPRVRRAAFRAGASAALLATGFVVACAGPIPRGAPRAGSPVPATPTVAPEAARWVVRPSGEVRSHRLQIDAVLVSLVDSVERTDSLSATLRTDWTYGAPPSSAREIPARIAGMLTDYRVAFGGAAAATLSGLSLPVAYAAEQRSQTQQPQFTLPRVDDCGPAAAAVAALRELWVSPPESLFVGRVWADSAVYTTCRDSIPLTVHSTRTFRVVGALSRAGRPAVQLERRSVVRMTGTGTQFGEPLEVGAEGRGVMQLDVALEGGAILAGSGESELRMTLEGRRRTQRLEQRTRIVISRP